MRSNGYLTPSTENDGYLTPSNGYLRPLFLSDNSTENDNYDGNHKKGPHKVDIYLCMHVYSCIHHYHIFSYHISYIRIYIYIGNIFCMIYGRVCICIYDVFMMYLFMTAG
jgi:hypothetical protein